MLHRCKIIDSSYGKDEECAILTYDDESDQYAIRIPKGIDCNRLPAIPAILAQKGVYDIDDRFARRFVIERIIPPDRQNIGEILRVVGLSYYQEFPLLMYCSGRCCMDDFWLEEINNEDDVI